MHSNEILEICNDAIVDTDTMDVPFLEDGEMIVQCRNGMRYRITIEDITEDIEVTLPVKIKSSDKNNKCVYQWNEGGLYKRPDLCSNRNVSSSHCIKAQGHSCDRFVIQTSILDRRWNNGS